MLLNFEAETKSLRPRPKFWPPGQFGLEALTLQSSQFKFLTV